MLDDFELPPSLAAVADLTFDFMRREERADGLHSPRTPVLLCTGPRGTGKSVVLTNFRDDLAGKYPCAYLDGEWPIESTWDMLALLAFELNQENRYGTLPFPRLTTGEIVVTASINLDITRAVARQQISDVLAQHQRTKGVLEDTVMALARGAAQSLTAYSPVATGIASAVADLVGKYGAQALLGKLAKTSRGRARILGTGQEWWGHQGRGLGGDAIDKLITLRQNADRARARHQGDADPTQQGSGGSRGEVTRQLWAAFLADLRENFADRDRAVNWTRNCVLLLDNADAAIARLFLQELVSERKQRERNEPDPLTVTAASRGGLAQPVRLAGLTPVARASVGHYLRRPATEAAAWWYPVSVSPLSWHETSRRVRELALAEAVPDIDALTSAVHALAGGHLGATLTLAMALAEQPRAASALDIPALLAAPEPQSLAPAERTVERALLAALLASLGEKNEAAVGDLATCAAARHREAALRLSTDPRLMEQLPGEERAIFTAEFWGADAAGVPAFLYPVLRRLLLRRLAAREPDAAASWARVHLRLRHRARTENREGGELYHTLALAGTPPGELAFLVAAEGPEDPLAHAAPLQYVARQLTERLAVTDAQTWLNLVACVTAAPNRLDHARAPRDQVRAPHDQIRDQVSALTSWAGRHEVPIAPIARFVAYSWLGADPLAAPHWKLLLRQMASDLDLFATHSDDAGLAVLRDEAQRYREIADGNANWPEVTEFWMSRVRLADETNRGADQ